MTQQFDDKNQSRVTDPVAEGAPAPVESNGISHDTATLEPVHPTSETALSAQSPTPDSDTLATDPSPATDEPGDSDAEVVAPEPHNLDETLPNEATLADTQQGSNGVSDSTTPVDSADAAATEPLEVTPASVAVPQDASADAAPADVPAETIGEVGSGEAAAAAPEIAQPELLDMTSSEPIMAQLLRQTSSLPPVLKRGEVREGIVAFKSPGEILVDVNAKSEGSVPAREFQQLSADDFAKMQIGDSVLVYVVQPENQDGVPVLSIDKTLVEKAWRRLQTQFEAGDTLEAVVSDYNKGGVLVELGGVRGFVPSSQISRLVGASEATRQADMQRLINTKLPLKIIEIDRPRNRLILSERQAVQEQRDQAKDRIMVELEEGQTREGTVASIADFGAFVDIGGIDGLVHLSELSWSRVSRPQDVVRVGDRVKVVVLSVDKNTRKVALSIKQAQPEPWTRVMAQYQQGQVVEGTITQIANFGAFARIADGVEGLIHVSELAEGRVVHPRDVVKDGDVVNVKIIRIDPERRRMGLSIRQAAADGYAAFIAGPTFTAQQNQPQTDAAPIDSADPAPTADSAEVSDAADSTEGNDEA